MKTDDMVLYVAKDKRNALNYCPGSVMCLQILELLPHDFVNVQDCDTLRNKGVTFPSWLNGTPTLISKATGEIYKGTNALQFLRDQLEEYSENINRKKEEKNRVSRNSMYEKESQRDEDEEELHVSWDLENEPIENPDNCRHKDGKIHTFYPLK